MKVLTTEQIFSAECRGGITKDEKLRFSRQIESMVLRKLKEQSAQGPMEKEKEKLVSRLRELADIIENGGTIISFSSGFGGNLNIEIEVVMNGKLYNLSVASK